MRKLAIFLLIIIMIVLVFAGCLLSKPTTPQGNSPTAGQNPSPVFNSPVETTSPVIVTSIPASTSPTSTTPSPLTSTPTPASSEIQTIVIDKPVPASYTTYTDPNGLFKISYPGDWEIPPDKIKQIADNSSQVSQALSGIAIYNFVGNLLFSVRVRPSYPVVNLYYLPRFPNPTPPHPPETTLYKTSVGGRDAMMVEKPGFDPDNGIFRVLILQVKVNIDAWRLECSSRPKEYDKWSDDFKAIAGSLRILK
jgi:hypothetical protein